jgi:mannose-6-phosphate isomerase-like protein (cupin superfamily)
MGCLKEVYSWRSMRLLLPLALIAATCALAAEVPGFVEWKAAQFNEAADRLEKKIGKEKMVFETIGNWKGHSVYLVLRGATSPPEFHETEKDVYIIQKGKATFVIGGELVDEEKRPRKQRRGSSIRGGIRRELAPGDIIHIPEATPHQLLINPGEPFMYILIHFDEEPLLNK